jgi:hypothetical protein
MNQARLRVFSPVAPKKKEIVVVTVVHEFSGIQPRSTVLDVKSM